MSNDTLDDFNVSLRMRDVLDKHFKKNLERLRPEYKYATVANIDRENLKCYVVYPGSPSVVPVSMGSVQPNSIGQTVRVDGLPADRHIEAVIGAAYGDGAVTGPTGLPIYPVIDYGADPSGATDSTAAFNEANDNAHTTGGWVFIDNGDYKTNDTFDIVDGRVHWLGASSRGTRLFPINSGDCINVQMPGTLVGHLMDTCIQGFTIDGTNAQPDSIGLHYGDTVNGRLVDLAIYNFDDVGLFMHNRTNYTEGTWWEQVYVAYNGINVLWDVDPASVSQSFGYQKIMGLRMVVAAGQIGMQVQGCALIYNSELHIMGNLEGNPTAQWMKVIGSAARPVNTGVAGNWGMMVEQTTGTPNTCGGIELSHYGFIRGHGVIDLGSLGDSTIVSNQGSFDVTGHVFVPGFMWRGESWNLVGSGVLFRDSVAVPGWQNSWTQDGAGVQFKCDTDGRMQLAGRLKGGTGGTVAFTLPAGARPVQQINKPVSTSTGINNLVIESNGDVKPPVGGTGWTDLEGVSFFVPLS